MEKRAPPLDTAFAEESHPIFSGSKTADWI